MEKVTLYTVSDMMGNVVKVELTLESLAAVTREEYAQYKELLTVVGTPKRKRKQYRYRSQGRYAFFIVARGWNLPEPESMFGAPKKGNIEGITVSSSRYSSHDPRWITDFMEANYSKLDVIAEDINQEYKKAA